MPVIRPATLLLTLCVSMVGCGMDETKFLENLYAEQCAYEFACQPGISEDVYGDEEGCEAIYEPYIADALAYFDGCRFEAGEARSCLKMLRNMDCVTDEDGFDELLHECDIQTVWSCEVA